MSFNEFLSILAFVRSAPEKLVLENIAPVKSELLNTELVNIVPIKFAFCRLAP